MMGTAEPVTKIVGLSLDQAAPPNAEKTGTSANGSSSKDEFRVGEEADVEQGTAAETTATALARVASKFGDRPECFANTLQETSFVFMATVAMATTSFLGGTAQIITVAVSQDLSMTQGQIAWITASTSLVAGAFQLALGQLADLLGRKLMFVAGLGLFSAFSLLVAFAQSPLWLLAVCGALGLFSAMVVPPAIGILGAAYAAPSRRKNVAFSAFSSGNPLGFAFGTVLCGVAAQIASWRAAFVLLCIIWAAFTALALWAVPSDVENFEGRAPLRERLGALRRFDYVGTTLTIFGTGMFTAGLTLGPEDGWARPQVIALLAVGVFLLVVFVQWERVFPTPLMPPHIWKDRNFSFIMIVVLLGNMAFTSIQFWAAFFMQDLQRLTTLMIAIRMLPMAIGGLLWNIIAGRILHRINNTALMAFGSVCYLAASLLVSFMKPDSSYWAFLFPGFVLSVAGADFQFNVANIYVMQSLPSHQQSLAGGIFNVVIRLAQAVVLGISTAVFSSIELTPGGVDDPMLKYTRTFQVSVALSALGLLFSPFIRLGTQGNTPEEPETERITEKSPDAVRTET